MTSCVWYNRDLHKSAPGGAANTPRADTEGLASMPRQFTPNVVQVEGDTARLLLTNRQHEVVARAVIDLDDLGRVLAAGRWYPSRSSNCKPGKQYYVLNNSLRTSLHRFVLQSGSGEFVDHVNHDPLDCRKANLRVCTHTQNMQNRCGAHRHSKSGVRNVYYDARHNRWRVEVRAGKVRHNIGAFPSLEEAAEAAAGARQRLHKEFAA